MTSPRPGGSVQARPLGWMYAWVMASLFSVGVVAGRLFFVGYQPTSLAYARDLTRCARGAEFSDPAFAQCLAGPARAWGLTMLAGGLLVLAAAVAVAVLLPLTDRRGLRRQWGRFPLPGAHQRFAELCDEAGLTGRRRPELLVAGPPVRQAFTAGGPGRRPLVVLPAALAVAYLDQDRFDPIVRHELGHVAARDVTWVSVLRSISWLVVPALLLALLPELARNGLSVVPATVLTEAAAFVVVTAGLAAGLLRLRELAADAHAIRAGSAEGLRALLSAAGRSGRPRWRFLARHPTPERRLTAIDRPGLGWVGGFGQALALGFGATMLAATVTAVTGALHLPSQGWLAPLVGTAAGAILLAGGLTPSLVRRAVDARSRNAPADWARPLAGAPLGVMGGALLSPVVAIPGQAAFPFAAEGYLASAAAVCLAGLAAIGAVAFAIVLASSGARSAVIAIAAAAAALGAFLPVPAAASVFSSFVDLRAFVVFGWPAEDWSLVVLVAPLVLLMAVRIAWPFLTAGLLAGLVAGLVGGLIGWLDPVAGLIAVQQRWWLSAVAGLAVLLAGWARPALAVPVAFAATLTAGLTQVVGEWLTGAEGLSPRLQLGPPLVWLAALVGIVLPILVLLSDRVAPDPVTVSRGRSEAAALGLTVVAGLLVVVVGVPGGYASVPDSADRGPAAASPTPPPTSTPTPGASRPAGPLTAAQARQAVEAAGATLPRGWRKQAASPPSSSTITPAACRDLAEDTYLEPLKPAERVRASQLFRTVPGPVGVVSTQLTMTVTSYAQAVPADVFAAAERARAACDQFDAGTPDGFAVHFEVVAHNAPRYGDRAFRVDYRFTAGGLTGNSSFVVVSQGTSLVTGYLSAIEEPLDLPILDRALAASLRELAGT